jgi:hypothetical protein
MLNKVELDLREELSRTFNGSVDEVAKGQMGLIRTMRIGEDNKQIRCVCRDKQTDEPSRDSYCRYCLGSGFLWDERKMLYYKNESSFMGDRGFFFYIEYDKEITTKDYIVEIKLDRDGEPLMPISRNKLYNILEAFPHKADAGRREFWKVQAVEERDWSVFYGVKNRQTQG